ncbi:hypothetical protein [Azospirillum endophyticum]
MTIPWIGDRPIRADRRPAWPQGRRSTIEIRNTPYCIVRIDSNQ